MSESLQDKIYKATNAICGLMNDTAEDIKKALAAKDYCTVATKTSYRNGLQQTLTILDLIGIELVEGSAFLSKLITEI